MITTFNTFRWIARITGLLVCLFFLFIFVGEAVSPHKNPNEVPLDANAVLQVTLTFIGIIGLLAAWKWELPGGVVGVIAFVALAIVNPRTFPMVTAIFLTPAILFVVTGLFGKRPATPSSEGTVQGSGT